MDGSECFVNDILENGGIFFFFLLLISVTRTHFLLQITTDATIENQATNSASCTNYLTND